MVNVNSIECTKCKSDNYVKAGFHHGKQRYKCKVCNAQFARLEDKNAKKRALALYLYMLGLSMNEVGRLFGVAPSTVLYWTRNFALKAYDKPNDEHRGLVSLAELPKFIEGGVAVPSIALPNRYITALPVHVEG